MEKRKSELFADWKMTDKVAILLGILFSCGFVAFFAVLCSTSAMNYARIEQFYVLAATYAVALCLWSYGIIVKVSLTWNLSYFELEWFTFESVLCDFFSIVYKQ